MSAWLDPTSIYINGDAFTQLLDDLTAELEGIECDVVAGLDAMGFVLGAAIATRIGVGFLPIRKAGKLPRETHAVSYDLEYGSATLEVHRDAVRPGDRVLLVDDVLATGGTARATAELVQACGAVVVGVAVLMDLAFLPWRAALGDVEVTSLLTVE